MAFITPLPALRRTPTLRSHTSLRTAPHTSQPARRRNATIQMAGGPKRSTLADTPAKQFLERFKPLGKVRLIARNDAAIMEAIATFDGLFYATVGSKEYANVVDMSINLDMHLLLSAVTGARFEIGVSRSASKDPTYAIRILGGDRETTALSVFVQWEKVPADISPDRVEAWKQLKSDYVKGDGDTFFFDQQ